MLPILVAKTFALATLALLLGACASRIPDQPPVTFEHSISERQPTGCRGEHCPLVNLDRLHFPSEPALNRLIDERLRRMTRYTPDTPPPPTLEAYERDFLASAGPGWSTWLQAQVRDWHGPLLVIELSSYLDRGEARGRPGRGFINYHLEQDRELKLANILEPGKEGAFWRLAEAEYRRWLQHNPIDPAEHGQWRFQRTRNIALLRDRVLLKYDVASIAPYASGHPELSLSYTQLQNVLRSDYLD